MAPSKIIEDIADEVMEKHGQSAVFEKRFLNFYENTIADNLGDDLRGLINAVELSEEEKLDES